MFGKNYDQEIKDLKNKIQDLELEISKLKTHVNSLRGLFNRKFEPTETIKNNPSVDGLDTLRENA